MIKSSPRDLPSTLSRCECSGLRRPPIRLRRRRPKTASAASAHAGPFKPRRYRPRRANGAVPSRQRPAAHRVLEITTRAPPNPFLALIGASARRESGPRSTPTFTSCQRAGRRPTLRVVPSRPAVVQFMQHEPPRPKRRLGPPRIFFRGMVNFFCVSQRRCIWSRAPARRPRTSPVRRQRRARRVTTRSASGLDSEYGTVLSAVSYDGQVRTYIKPVARPKPRACSVGRSKRVNVPSEARASRGQKSN